MNEEKHFDALVFGAHPDDVELHVGGTVRRMVLEGRRVAIADLSKGEIATRGSIEERREEAACAAQILGISKRTNLGLPDGDIKNNPEQRSKVIECIRELRPTLVIFPFEESRHPDHRNAYHLIKDAIFFAGVGGIQTHYPRYQPRGAIAYLSWGLDRIPSCITDISDTFEVKMEALRAYSSQFHNPDYEGEETYLTRPEFFDEVEARARFFGTLIGVDYGEPLVATGPLPLKDPLSLWAG